MLEPRPDLPLTPDRSGFIRVFDAYLTRRADSNVGRARNAAPRTIHHVELRHTPHGGPSLSQPLEHGRSSSCTRCVCLYHHYSLLELLRCVFPRHRTLCRNPFLIHTHIHVDQVLTHVCDISTYRIPVQYPIDRHSDKLWADMWAMGNSIVSAIQGTVQRREGHVGVRKKS